MKSTLCTLLVCLVCSFTLLGQENCVTLGNTSFEKGQGMCYSPDSENVKHKTAKALVTNNCNREIVVTMFYDGELNVSTFSGSPLKQRINSGGSYEFKACFVKENKGQWKIKNVSYSSENENSENEEKGQNESSEYPTINGVEVTHKTKLYYDYMEKGEAAEANGDYSSAIIYYQNAYDLIPSSSLELKIRNLREWEGAATMVEAASVLSQIEVKGFGGYNGINISTFKSSENTRDLSLAFQNGMFNRIFTGGVEAGFAGSARRNIDVYFRTLLGLGIGTSHFGIYAIGFAGFTYRLKQWDYSDERFLLHPGWGFRSYIKLKNRFINFRLCKVYGSGRYDGAWEFGIGIGW